MTRRPIAERLWSKAKADGTGCWVWSAGRTKAGYGRLGVNGKGDYAHRISYRLRNGAIPEGLQIDHLCRNRACINPDHLEAVTQRENILRGTAPAAQNARVTECPKGHQFDKENTYRPARGGRECRACRSEAQRRRNLAGSHPLAVTP